MLLMKWKYAQPKTEKRREHISYYSATYEIEIHTGWKLKVAGTCQQWLITRIGCLWNGNTHWLRVEGGVNMSALIAPLMKCKYALAEIQKWREYVTVDCTTYQMKIRTGWKSKVTGNCQTWLCCSWNGNTHRLGVKSGVDMSAMIVLLMKWKYVLPEIQKCREHVNHDCATHEMEIRTGWGSKVAGTCQPYGCAAHEMDIRTHWESKVTGACQPWLCCSWNGNTHNLRGKSSRNISVITLRLLLMKWKYTLAERWKWRYR